MQISGIDEEKVSIFFLLCMLAGRLWNSEQQGTDDGDLFHMRDEACKVAEITTAQAISLNLVTQQVQGKLTCSWVLARRAFDGRGATHAYPWCGSR